MKGFSLGFVAACALLCAVTAHQTPDAPKPRWDWDEPTVLRPGRVYIASVAESSMYAVAVEKGDAVAVQIQRTSYRRVVADEPLPRVRVCHGRGCAYETHNGTLSFAFTAKQAQRYARTVGAGRAVLFALDRTTVGTSATVAVMVCVGPNASLATCRTACTLNCDHGVPSTLLNACVCTSGYTGIYCGQETTNYTRHDFDDSEFADWVEFVVFVVAFVCWSVMAVLMAVFVVALIVAVCVFFRACCCGGSTRRGRVLGRSSSSRDSRNSNQNTSSHSAPPPPPPPYPGVAYHPLNVVPPPPPPPPAPLPVPNNSIEMARFPANSPTYILPPPAPVRDIPVYPQRPVPKN